MTDHPGELFQSRSGRAPTFGWVRRKDLDTPSVDAWEMPDGKLYAAKKGQTPVLVRVALKDTKP